MKRAICIGVAVAAVTTAALGQAGQGSRSDRRAARGSAQARKTLDTYCAGCHNSRVRAGGVAFDTLTLDAVHEHADVWEKSVRKLRGRLMPPPGSRQPDQREIDAFVTWMESDARCAAASGRRPPVKPRRGTCRSSA